MDKEIKEENATGEKKEETKSGKKEAKSPFTAKKLALIAAFTALAFGASFLDFPVFPAAPFLKLDFSFAIMLLAAYIIGPLGGEIVVLTSFAISLPFSQTAMIGEFANLIMAQFFVVLPAVAYKFRRKFSTVIISLSAATIVISAVGLLTNRFLLFPLHMGEGAAEFFASVWYFIVAFNAIKGVSNAIITVLLYKRLKKVLSRFL